MVYEASALVTASKLINANKSDILKFSPNKIWFIHLAKTRDVSLYNLPSFFFSRVVDLLLFFFASVS